MASGRDDSSGSVTPAFMARYPLPDEEATFTPGTLKCWKLLRKAEDKANAAQDATTAAEAAKKMSEIAQLHEEALEADPENPDALMRQTSLLEFERDGLTAGYARAAEVAKKQLGGDEYFEANVGCFWHNVETRPYCRARLNQILSLLEESSAEKGREVAVREMRELLRLMSDDKFQLGTRLVTELLILGRPEAALVYMKEERLTGTLWELLDEALLEFMVNGPFEPPVSATMTAGAVGEGAAGAGGAGGSSSEAATAASRLPGTPQLCAESRVRSACRLNSHVVPLMIGLRRAKFMRQNEGAGGWDEANELVQLREEHWKKTPGALTWLSAAAYPICRQKCANPECMEIEPSLGAFSICSRCHETPYCSRDCQRAHWKAHKGPCRTMFLK